MCREGMSHCRPSSGDTNSSKGAKPEPREGSAAGGDLGEGAARRVPGKGGQEGARGRGTDRTDGAKRRAGNVEEGRYHMGEVGE